MPLYDFVCDDCGHKDELFFHMKENKISKCPLCNGGNFIRQYTVCGAIIDSKKPKTIGEQAQKNTETKVKRGELPKLALEADERRNKRKKLLQKRRELTKLNGTQMRNYIETGQI